MIVDNQLSPSVLGRSAFCEEKLSEAVKQGCSQYLLFASGYDTFALRNSESSLSIYELDFPELLADKRMRTDRGHMKSMSVDESKETRTNQTLASGAGEQMKALYSRKEMEALLQRCGFAVMEHLDDREMTDRYFEEYNQNNPMHPMKAPKGVGYVTVGK